MNYGVVIKVLGNLLFFKAISLLLPLAVAILHQGPDIRAFVYSLLLTISAALVMRSVKPKKDDFRIREALLIVVLGWFFVSAFGTLPFLFSGSIATFTDAFFESVSALTTTGATVIDDIEILPHGVLFWRSFMHWLGGMGILVLALAVLPMTGVGGFHLFRAESPGPISDKLAPKLKDTAKILYTAYAGLTALQTVLLLLGGMSLYDALVHTFATMGTGGFSTYNDSIGAFDSGYIRMVISIFMLAAGVNFSLYFALYQGKWRRVWRSDELRWYLGIIGVSTLLVTLSLSSGFFNSFGERFQHAFFQVTSFITTTGFTTTNYEQWPPLAQMLLFMLMFVGGSAGSTAGGIKVVRWLTAGKLVGHEMRKIIHPRAFTSLHINGKPIGPEVISSVTAFLFLYGFIFLGGSLLLALFEQTDIISALSASAATLGNIGPGFGVVGPDNTYSGFLPISKYLMAGLMLLGRLELFTFFLLFTPSFWRH